MACLRFSAPPTEGVIANDSTAASNLFRIFCRSAFWQWFSRGGARYIIPICRNSSLPVGSEGRMNAMLIDVEREQLDHQRARLEEILAADMVSQAMRSDLRRLLDDISRRLGELAQPHDRTHDQPVLH